MHQQSPIRLLRPLYQIEYELKGKGEINIFACQIVTTNHAIYRLVYELYGLTEDEIKIVEDSHS